MTLSIATVAIFTSVAVPITVSVGTFRDVSGQIQSFECFFRDILESFVNRLENALIQNRKSSALLPELKLSPVEPTDENERLESVSNNTPSGLISVPLTPSEAVNRA